MRNFIEEKALKLSSDAVQYIIRETAKERELGLNQHFTVRYSSKEVGER